MRRTVLAAMLAAAMVGSPLQGSKDAGLYQSSPVGQDGWEHVAFHGWADNFEPRDSRVLGAYMCQGEF